MYVAGCALRVELSLTRGSLHALVYTNRTIVMQIGVAHPDGLSGADVSPKLPESVGASARLGDAMVSVAFGSVPCRSCH